MKPITVAAGVLFLTLLVASSFAAETRQVTAQIGQDGIQRVEIDAGSYFFNPNGIILKANVPAELRVRKEWGIAPHDITMNSPEAGMKFQVSLETEPKIVRFVPAKTGKYPFYCSQKLFGSSHREKGMEGTIEVVP